MTKTPIGFSEDFETMTLYLHEILSTLANYCNINNILKRKVPKGIQTPMTPGDGGHDTEENGTTTNCP